MLLWWIHVLVLGFCHLFLLFTLCLLLVIFPMSFAAAFILCSMANQIIKLARIAYQIKKIGSEEVPLVMHNIDEIL